MFSVWTLESVHDREACRELRDRWQVTILFWPNQLTGGICWGGEGSVRQVQGGETGITPPLPTLHNASPPPHPEIPLR